MKLGDLWNVKGRRPRAHEPARDTGPRSGPSGVSVGEWLNSVIQRSDGGDEPYQRPLRDSCEPMPSGAPLRRERDQYRDSTRGEAPERRRDGGRHRDADYGARSERPREHGPYRAPDRNERRYEGGPYRESSRDERYEHRHERQPLGYFGRDERHESRREGEFYRGTEHAEPHQPPSDDNPRRHAERAEQQERQQGNRGPIAARDEPHQRRDADHAPQREPAADERQSAARDDVAGRNEFEEVNARLDKLGQQLERLARAAVAPQQPALVEAPHEPHHLPPAGMPPPVRLTPSEPLNPPVAAALPQRRRAGAEPSISIDDAVAEIAARQRVLDGDSAAGVEAAASAEATASVPGPALDFGSLEQLLRQITARIEALQPSQEIEAAIAAVRGDLAEIGKQLNEALPRQALESLESEIKALAARINFSRQAGIDPNALAGLEHGLADVRQALRGLTTAENLVGADEAVQALAQKVDMILARDDPTMLQQLETAIGGLRGVVAHVASNDTLNKVAQDVRVLAAQVDVIANNAATAHAVASLEQRIDGLTAALHASSEAGHAVPCEIADHTETAHAVASLEQRIDALTAALHASSEAGQAVPHDLEKLLTGLIEKLEWVQLTNTDHAAVGHLEDRIAMLVKRFDASEARFAQLEGIERGLTDLLVHMEQTRSADNAAAWPAWHAPAAVPADEEPVAASGQTEPHTDESPIAMHETVEHVADRLAMIESNVYDPAALAVPAQAPVVSELPQAPVPQHTTAEPVVANEILSLLAAAPVGPAVPIEAAAAVAAPQQGARPPIDPTLPPDHPLEPGFTGSRPRSTASAAERVAASEAAIGSAKPPVIPDAGRPNFIAAARRAAQAAAREPSTAKARNEPQVAEKAGGPSKLSQRLRQLVVAGSALLIVVGCARIALRLFDDGHPIGSRAAAQSEQIPAPAPSAPAPLAQKAPPAIDPAPEAPSLPLPNPGAAAPPPAPAPPKTVKPEQQSLQQDGAHEALADGAAPSSRQPEPNALPLWATPDITSTLPHSLAGAEKPRAAAPASAAAASDDDLPAAIGDPALRAAAIGGDPAAAYEIAARFAEGHRVTKNNTAAAHWLERAANQGLAPAQFRLGGIYEKGIGVKKDLVRARELYLAAAQKGNGKAMHNLAVLYAEGVDGTPDYTSAAEWFRRGADHGVSDSQYNLGILYGRGIGVKQDYAESYKWFALAANQGDHDAAGKRDEVVGHLDAKALAAARAAVQNFKPEPQPDEAINVKTAAALQPPAKAN